MCLWAACLCRTSVSTCVCLGGCMDVVASGGEANGHTPPRRSEDDHSWNLFKTHTIWVARLQNEAGTAASVSDGKRFYFKKDTEPRRAEKLLSSLCLRSISPIPPPLPPCTHTHTHTHTHTLYIVRNFQPSCAWDATQHCSMWSLPAQLWDSSASS